MNEVTEITYEIHNCQEISPQAPDKNMLHVWLFSEGAWREVVFDKALALEVAEKIGEMAATL